jgi:signal transduction histidine kinase/ligand-binding sensor domain-containing protein
MLTLFFGQRAAADTPYLVDVWNTDDHLPENSVIAIAQTHDGYLWLGTLNGLARFDGSSFTPFNVNNTPGLPSNRIVFLFEDSGQTLWVGTDTAGLCAIKNGVVQSFPETAAGGPVNCAFEAAGGSVWFGAQNGNFLCWKNGKIELHPADVSAQIVQQLFFRSVHLLVPGKNGVVWQLQDGHVRKFRGGKLEKDYGLSPWQSSLVYTMRQTPEGQPGVVSFDLNITAACEDAAGNLVVGTKNEGLFWFQPDGSCVHLTKNDGLSNDIVLSLSLDREGNLWAGTDGGGLDRIKRKVFFSPAGLSAKVAQSVAQDAAGGLWVAFNSHGLAFWLTNVATSYGIGNSSNAWTVLVDRHQQVWAGTRGEGLFQFESNYFRPVLGAEKIGREIFALFEDHAGIIWVGSENGLGRFDGTNWNFFTPRDGLPNSAVRALAEGAPGNLWIGTERDGLFQLSGGKISPVHAPVNDISCLLTDVDGGLWVGTSGHGLAHLQNAAWKTCSTLNGGLTSDSIGYLIKDDAGNLWLGSYEGLMRVEKKSLADFAAGSAKTVSSRTFLTRECSAGAQPAASRAPDGRLFFPTIAGVVAVNPAELQPNSNPPPVVIESVRVDGVEQKTNALSAAWSGVIALTPNDEQLEIQFASLNFSAPKNTAAGARFKYRLEDGSQNDRAKGWTDIGVERVAHFQKLQPGQYNFHVIAGNEDGFWNETGASLAITVAPPPPPLWRRPAFIVTSVLVLLGALAGTIYLISTAKLKRQLRAAHQKELIERERARIARDLHDQLGANLTQVTLLGEMAEADKDLPGEIELHAQQICATARETTRSLDEIVWAVNPSNDTLEGLANYACKYAQDYFALAGVSFRSELPVQLPAAPILPEVRHNVFLAFKEAVNNVVKHAHATEARVKLQLAPGRFILVVADNGRGLGDISEKQLRNGLKNMRQRLADVHGAFEIAAGPEGGTVVRLTVPVEI